MSDGGDGFGEVMGRIFEAVPRRVRTVDAAHQRITPTWWYSEGNSIVESARTIGLALLPPGKIPPLRIG